MTKIQPPSNRNDFEVALICALPVERDAIEAMLDEEYETDGPSFRKARGDDNTYTTGNLGGQHVVIPYMPGMGTANAASVAEHLKKSFPNIKVGFVVGICGGLSSRAEVKALPKVTEGRDINDIYLGDVIVSHSVVQVDFGSQLPNRFSIKKDVGDTLGRANRQIRSFIAQMSGS